MRKRESYLIQKIICFAHTYHKNTCRKLNIYTTKGQAEHDSTSICYKQMYRL